MDDIKDTIELIVLRAISSATDKTEYNLGHGFGDKIEEKIKKDTEKIKQALNEEKESSSLLQEIESKIVQTIEREVIEAIGKMKKGKSHKKSSR